jgi:tetratricopeptide (TPR) repeat protein
MAMSPPDDVFDLYLRAAEAAEEGRLDDAEAGFRRVAAATPELPTARFQLGQLLWVRGAAEEAVAALAPLCDGNSSLAAYARAIASAALGDIEAAMRELDVGLALPQDNPALAGDMRRLLDGLRDAPVPVADAAASHALAAYGRQD